MRIALVIAGAFLVGALAVAVVAPPRATAPSPSPTSSLAASATPSPTDDPAAFTQPLVAACSVSRDEVYAVSLGGGIVRFDGRTWAVIDGTLRNLRAIACAPEAVVAVGDGGRYVRIDATRRTIRSDVIDDADLYAVELIGGSIYAAGADQVVVRFDGSGWQRIASGAQGVSWRAVGRGQDGEVWFAGDGGQLFAFDGRTFIDHSVPSGPDLVSVGPRGIAPLAGGADGCLYHVRERRPCAQPYAAPVRSIFSPDARAVYVAADALYSSGQAAGSFHREDTNLSCPPIAVFGTASDDVWVLARSDGYVGLAHFDGSEWTKVGRC